MPARLVPVRPDLASLEREAADLLERFNADEEAAVNEVFRLHPDLVAPGKGAIEHARLALARAYGLPDWDRLTIACRLIDAIWRDDAPALLALLDARPELLHEEARGVPGNWGPPLSYAANLGRDRIIDLLLARGARDLQHAFDRACLQGQLATARKLHAHGAELLPGLVMGPCETLSGPGLALLLDLGAPLTDQAGDPLAPLGLVLQTYCRNPRGKHQCLELLAAHGRPLPDTAPMAVHRGRIDLLEAHLALDPALLSRTFAHQEIYPPEVGCSVDESLALHGTPLAGGTLLHLCVDFDEIEMASWIIDHGGKADAPAAVDGEGFGGQTALFGCVVSQPWRVGRRRDDAFARLLLDHGADPRARASLRKRLRFVADETRHEYRDVTPLAWGERFHDQDWVSAPVMALLRSRVEGR